MIFPVAGLELPIWLPSLVAFCIGGLCASAGVSGAFLLLPFQVSVLGFTAPAVTPTNLLYNVFGLPGGILRYAREGRVDWTLSGLLGAGLVPGAFLGLLVRLRLLSDPARFKLFMAAVLLYLVVRIVQALAAPRRAGAARPPAGARVTGGARSWRRVTARLGDEPYSYRPLPVMVAALLAGTVGGAYGIGGGALMAPVLFTFFGLPVYACAGANMVGTLLASLAGALLYAFVGPTLAVGGAAVRPDWLLGALFGAGGLLGMYLGAAAQRHLPERLIKGTLAALLLGLVAKYALETLG